MPPPILVADARDVGHAWVHYWVDQLPPDIRQAEFLGLWSWQWIGLLILLLGAFALGTVIQWLATFVIRRLTTHAQLEWDEELVRSSPGPLRWALFVVLFYLLLPLLELPAPAYSILNLLTRTVFVIIGAWVLIRLASLIGALLEAYLVRQTTNPALQRSIRTQIMVPLRVLRFLVVLLAFALVLIQFDLVRNVGLSMLASAGVAGVVIGLAAQRTVANLLAGIQLAVFQPIRIGDAVVVEGDYGFVEEIGLTYVVIRIWDDRRLILPVGYFLERPFQNWTRQSPEMLGTVTLLTDFLTPISEIRAELSRILSQTHLWDGRVQVVQVINFTEVGVEVRILVSAADSARLWELRCLLREKILEWLQAKGRDYLPMRRTQSRQVSS